MILKLQMLGRVIESVKCCKVTSTKCNSGQTWLIKYNKRNNGYHFESQKKTTNLHNSQ